MNLWTVRVGLRLARRELRARPARTLLVVLLIVAPTTAMTVVTTFYRTSELSWRELRAATYGTAASRAYFVGYEAERERFTPQEEPTDADIEALKRHLPDGTPILVERNAIDRVRGRDFAEQFVVVNVDLTSPLAKGKYTLMRGRAPQTAEEAVLGEDLADALNVGLGSTVRPERLGVALRVVGLMRSGDAFGHVLVTRAPVPPLGSTNVFIAATPDRSTIPGWTREYGQEVHVSRTDSVVWTYVGGAIGMFALGTIVAAAFALGARRQLRSLGLLAATGASPRTIAWALTAQGVFAGVVGSIVGVALGVIGVHLVPTRLLQSLTTDFATSPAVRPVDLVPIVVMGIVAAAGAAAFPARAASRIAVLQALASRRPVERARRGTLLLAVTTLAFSAGILAWTIRFAEPNQSTPATAAVVFASVLPFVAALLAAPLLVGRLEHWVRVAPLSWRLAGRSLARNRARSASVIGATCAVVGVAVAGATLVSSWTTRVDDVSSIGAAVYRHAFLQPNQVFVSAAPQAYPDANGNIPDAVRDPVPADERVVTQAQAVVPSALRIDLIVPFGSDGRPARYRLDRYEAGPTYGPSSLLAIATPELMELFDPNDEVRRRLARGDAILVQSPGAKLRETGAAPRAGEEIVLRVGAVVETPQAALALPRILISAERAADLGWSSAPSGVTVLAASRDFTPRERRQLRLVAEDLYWEQTVAGLATPGSVVNTTNLSLGEAPSASLTSFQLRVAAFAATAVLVLAVIAIGVGLAARDNKDETAVLEATGAAPRVRRQVGTRRAVLLVVTATLIAIPAGVIPSAAVVLASTATDYQFRLDWPALFALAFVLPVVVGSTTATGGWIRDHIRGSKPAEVDFVE